MSQYETYAYSLSYREVQELLAERGINVDHSTIWRWVQRYAPELALRQRAHLKPTNKSWRVDETYVRVKGEWCYLYRAVDSEGATVEFFLSAFRDKESAQSLFRRAIRHGAPRTTRHQHRSGSHLPDRHRGSAALGRPAAPLPAPARAVPQ